MYGMAYRLASRAVHGFPLLAGRLAASVAGRAGAPARWVTWARDRSRGAPPIWLHAASVGETQAALPVIRRLTAARPGTRCVLTYTSPSTRGWTFPGIDHADYLPLDHPAHVGPVIAALRPAVIVLSRGDLWPELVGAAGRNGVAVVVTGGMISPDSARLRWPARDYLRAAAASLGYVGTVSLEDAGRWRRLGARPETLRVSGDPRHDFVLERAVATAPATWVRDWAGGIPVLVAGSIERDDEPPLAAVLRQTRGGRSLVVPHDGTPEAARALAERLRSAGIEASAWNAEDLPADAPTLVVATRGLLFDLYAAADIAYVGGGFGRAGVHAVIEPAAFGVPVLVGPGWRRHRDAADLVAAGGAAGVATAEDLAGALAYWLEGGVARRAAGLAARKALAAGAAAVDAAAVLALMGEGETAETPPRGDRHPGSPTYIMPSPGTEIL